MLSQAADGALELVFWFLLGAARDGIRPDKVMESEPARRCALDKVAFGKHPDPFRDAILVLPCQGGCGIQPEIPAGGGSQEPEDALVPLCQLPVGGFEGGEDTATGLGGISAARVG